jgi:hypothetical protein
MSDIRLLACNHKFADPCLEKGLILGDLGPIAVHKIDQGVCAAITDVIARPRQKYAQAKSKKSHASAAASRFGIGFLMGLVT